MSKQTAHLEAILFAASSPVSAAELAGLLELSQTELSKHLKELAAQLQDRGIRLMAHNHNYSLVSAPESADMVARFLKDQARTDLTKPALETLAIITYEQPITASRIEHLRGINSDQSIKGLLARGLIATAGNNPDTGEIRYSTSHKLLTHMGLSSAQELPPLPDQASAS